MTHSLHHLCGAIIMSLAGPTLAVDAYPARPVRIIVNSAPGALLDVTTRAVAQQMADNLGQPVVVENMAGAAGMLGIRYVKTQKPDGYTILATANTLALAQATKLEPGYDLARDFTGIGMMNKAPLLMVGFSAQPDKTLPQLIAHAKASPGSMSYATAGIGTSTHMAAALFVHQAGIKMLHVPYKGNAGAMPDVLGGRVNMIFDGANSSGPYVQDGKLRAFAVSSPKRLPAFPDIPTLAEQGLPNYSFYVYMGLTAPAGTPTPVVMRLAKALKAAQASDAVRERFRKDSAEAGNMSPEEFTEFLRHDLQRNIKVVADLGIPKE
ncbi:Bug family tripartite tricarboxylate transporter substrate binding protein [Cupriavidus alkaliphilus]|uniref:Tripartite-type tricarboxylate transporter receptor subunit TctC n=1 Tax=Cupriavidus alkaliphilus TaxID=942866 RepID=A0A7W4VDT2_9BURK|nr:tripartite tricarboxylate transporter substrate binding protein [Cupriavidus alkaliphilus]MBB3009757.1 tripartite-type tricarboxylate transporter receptor subunit TctC [Cupriavidus alkaliphilus]